MQKRYLSKVAWSAVTALILFVLKNWGLLEVVGLTETSYKELIDIIFLLLIGVGIFNNPTDAEHY